MKLIILFVALLLAGAADAKEIHPVDISLVGSSLLAGLEKDYLTGGPMISSFCLFDRWNWPGDVI